MGYYTSYNIECDKPEIVNADLAGFRASGAARYVGGENDNAEEWINRINNGDTMRWYERQDQMKALARLYPDVTWRITGDGEENGDQWVEFYHGDRFERREMPAWTPPKFPSWHAV